MTYKAMMAALAVTIVSTAYGPAVALAARPTQAETIVLVHGAFAGSSSWNGVVTKLVADGYRVVAAANPLRSLRGDGDYVHAIVAGIPGPVVLVGHSYGGEVISVAAVKAPNVKALVYVAGFAQTAGESAASLGDRFPTGTLGKTLAPPVQLMNGGKDLYIDQVKYPAQFAADVPAAAALQMAVTQRPITEAALNEASGPTAWDTLPSYFIYGSLDRNIPRALHAFLANRAKAKEAVEIKGASHVVMISHPRDVAAIIERAAAAK